MKQISAILIAFLLCTSATQVSAQEIRQMKEVIEPAYEFAPTDNWVIFKGPSVATTCTLPDAKTNKGRILHLLNRRGNKITISHPALEI